MNELIKVTVNGIEYVPLSAIAEVGGDETAKALLRMCVSGYYTNLHCHATGDDPRRNCDCSGCCAHRMIVSFLGGNVSCDEETDPGFILLEQAMA